jgi:hypothetical protein
LECEKQLVPDSGEAAGVKVESNDFKVYRLGMMWVDVVHLILYHLTTSKDAEHTVEGLHFYHWRVICDTIEQFWSVIWDKPSKFLISQMNLPLGVLKSV